MNDFIFVMVIAGRFCDERTLPPLVRKPLRTIMENIIVGLIAILLFGYLFVAMVHPEKF